MKRFVGFAIVGVLLALCAVAAHKCQTSIDCEPVDEVIDSGSIEPAGPAAPVSAETDCKCQCTELVRRVQSLEKTSDAQVVFSQGLSTQLNELKNNVLELQKVRSSPSPIRPVQRKTLKLVYKDDCLPCDQWKASGDRTKIEAECPLVMVDIKDLTGPKPDSVPAFTLEIDGMVSNHRGYLTYQRFKDMEKAIQDKLRSQ